MTRILDTHEFIGQADWSPDGQLLVYARGDGGIWAASTKDDPKPFKIFNHGTHPSWVQDRAVLAESSGEILLAGTDGGEKKVLVRKSDIFSPSVKDNPTGHPPKGIFVFTCHFLFDKESQSKNAYPFRHMLGLGSLDASRPRLVRQQWYGGTMVWFPDGERFAHFEYDSTGGAQIHVVAASGEEEAVMGGHFPAVSPSGAEIAARPKGGGGLLILKRRGATWNTDEIETVVLRLPEASGRLSPNPPWWIDARTVVVEEGRKLFKVDIRSDRASLLMEIPELVERGEATLWPSPDRSRLAAVVRSEGGQSLILLETLGS